MSRKILLTIIGIESPSECLGIGGNNGAGISTAVDGYCIEARNDDRAGEILGSAIGLVD
jgi:putative protein kinase ArgK-like GTPase of G3E family